jgi:lysophospholipase L1-like esterase
MALPGKITDLATCGFPALLAAALALVAAAGSAAAVPANNPAISYEGRHAPDASGAVRLGFPGVSAHLRFRGRTLTMHASASEEDLYFDVSTDGAAPTLLRLHRGEGDYPVVQSESVAEHNVVLTRRNESWQGTVALLGFDPGRGGELLPPPAVPPRKLMFIGDSVTCGEMVAYEPGRDMKDKMNWNARLSYGMLLARRFGAQCHLVSYGGRGIIRDWQGIRDTRNAPQFYELALPDDPAVRWDHSRYIPDAIGLQLGTNDFNQGVPDQNEFVNAYVEFIRKIRRDAPGALIFVMDSPIVDDEPVKGPRRTVLHAYLEQVVARAGGGKVLLAPLKHYPGVPGNGHPTGQEHEAMAAELAPLLQRALDW